MDLTTSRTDERFGGSPARIRSDGRNWRGLSTKNAAPAKGHSPSERQPRAKMKRPTTLAIIARSCSLAKPGNLHCRQADSHQLDC